MPEVGSKKRNQQTGSGKLSKRGGSLENAPAIEVAAALDEETDTENLEILIGKNEPEEMVILPEKTTLVKDIMRTEPALNSIYIENYDGGYDENMFYHGKGLLNLKDGMTYSGEFKHGKMHDNGEIRWLNDTSFNGDLDGNIISGCGTYCWPDGSTYKGEVKNGLRNGPGTFICSDLKTYTGEWKDGKRHGKGVLYFDKSGLSYYNGDWFDNEKCGYGIRHFPNGNKYEGEWKDNKRNGTGTMYWHTSAQEYSGKWVDGIQNGHGEYTWYLKRVSNSQYPLRNKYVGNFSNGYRKGHGIFYYASGAVYEGEWEQNMKHGKAKFTFKNGSTFSGQFHNDRMIDFPDLILPRMMTPDIALSGIPIKSAMSSVRSKSVMDMSQNAVDAILDLDLDDVFNEYKYDLEERQEEIESIMRIILRLTTQLKSVYKVYSCLGSDTSIDNTFVMSKCQFLRFLKDYNIHKLGYTLSDINRHIEETITPDSYNKEFFIRDFLNNLVKISYLLFKSDVPDDACIISNCFSKLLAYSFVHKEVSIRGYIFKSIKKTQEVYKFIDKIFEVYFYFTGLYNPSGDKSLKLRDVLMIMKEMNLINESLNSTKLVNLLIKEDQDEEGYFNLENEITPFEFVEVIVGSSSLFISDKLIEKLRPSHVLPILSLDLVNNIETEVSFIDKVDNEKKAKDEVTEVTESVSQEEITPKLSIEDSLSPVKNKSSKKINRKLSVGKKIEKEASTTSTLKVKKDGSKSGRKTSSIKLDDAKKKTSVPDTDIPVSISTSTNQDVSIEKSFDSTLENIPDSDVGIASIPSSVEIPPELSMKTEITNEVSSELIIPEPEKQESFELWSLRLNLFLKEYLFPAFEKRKIIEELVCAKKN